MRRTVLDEAGVRHLIVVINNRNYNYAGAACGRPTPAHLFDGILSSGASTHVDEGDHVVTCLECMSGTPDTLDAVAQGTLLHQQLEQSIAAMKARVKGRVKAQRDALRAAVDANLKDKK